MKGELGKATQHDSLEDVMPDSGSGNEGALGVALGVSGAEKGLVEDIQDTDLAQVVQAWPSLPAAIRQAIATMVEAVGGEDEP